MSMLGEDDVELERALTRELDRRLGLAMRAVRAARTLREVQRQYLRSRSRSDLDVVKQWERKLDAYLAEVPSER